MKIHLQLGRAKRRRVEEKPAAVPLVLDVTSQDASELGHAADNLAGRPLSHISSASSSSFTASSRDRISRSFRPKPSPSSDSAPFSPFLPPSLDPNFPNKGAVAPSVLRAAPYLPESDLPPPDVIRSEGEQISTSPFWDEKTVWRLSWREKTWIVKGGKGVEPMEADMTRVAWERTRLPIPQVYGVVTLGDESFIYLEDLPGSLLSNKWHTLSQPRLEHVFLNLRHVLHVLSTTYAPANTPVGAIGGSNLHALARRDEDWEPRTSPPVLPSAAALESWLHDLFLAGRQRFVSVKRQEAKWRRNITSEFNLSSPLVLVHGDFQAHNILIDDEGQITGLIDWEYGGWYPAWVETFPAAVALRQGAGPKTARLAEEVFGAAGMPLHSYRALIELHVAVRAALYSVIS